MPLFGLTENGLRPKQIDEIIFELGVAFRAEFGEETDLDAATSIIGQLISVYSEREALIWQLALAVYSSAYPDTAEGVSLVNVAAITGVTPLPATRSTVTPRCAGTPGTLIPAGRVSSVIGTNARFESLSDATILPSGTVDVLFRAQEFGAIDAPAGSLTVIETPVSGWDSIINETDADIGRLIESDTELRIRRAESLQVIGAATVDAIRARLLNEVADISDAIVTENDSDIVDGAGRPPHSLQVVVAGGTDQDIANKIWELRSAGIATFGAITTPVIDTQGFSHDISHDRAAVIRSFLHIQIEVGVGFNQGSKQKEKITVAPNDPGDTITISINGRDFVAVAGATAALTADAINTALTAGGIDWVPVLVTYTPTNDFLEIESLYKGNGFILTALSLSGNTGLAISEVAANSGDQVQIIKDVIQFADGDATTAKEQRIGVNVSRSRYFTPVNKTSAITSIEMATTEGAFLADFWPTTAPPAGGDWALADIAIASDEAAQLDTLTVTVEII